MMSKGIAMDEQNTDSKNEKKAKAGAESNTNGKAEKKAKPPADQSPTNAKGKTGKGRRKRKLDKKAKAAAKARRPYPTVTLNEALAVAQKIKELNGGNPWASEDVATALGVASKSSK